MSHNIFAKLYLPGPLRSLISTFRKGRKGFPQKGQVVFRLESSAVQPAMISSSYTRQSQVLQREQLEISNLKQTMQGSSEAGDQERTKLPTILTYI